MVCIVSSAVSRRLRAAARGALVVLALVLVQCSESGSGLEDVPPVETRIGVAGGAVSSGDVTLSVPAGALEEEVVLTIAPSAVSADIDGVSPVGPTIEVGPTGTVFAAPATVTLPFDAGSLPAGVASGAVRLWRSEAASGPYTELPSTVDAVAGTVSAPTEHLSFFVPGVPTPSGTTCREHGDCDCESVFADLPLDIIGSADLGRGVDRICHDDGAGLVRVLTNTWVEDGSGLVSPGEWFVTTLAASDLSVVEDAPASESALDDDPGTCAEAWREESHLHGADASGEITWSAEVVERFDTPGASRADWYEIILTIAGPEGTLRYSLNRHLNERAPYTDTNSLLREWLLEARNSLAGRIAADGSGHFYFHAWSELHLEVVRVGDVRGALRAAATTADEDGFHAPTSLSRYELGAGSTSSGYAFETLYLNPAPDDESEDVLVVFSPTGGGLRGFRFSSQGGVPTELPALDLDPIYGQFGWQNAGYGPAGLLTIQSQAAQFDAAVFHTLDPREFRLVDSWQIACVGAPTTKGLQFLPDTDGQLLRFAQPPLSEEIRSTARLEFIHRGELQAVGELPVHNVPSMWLVAGSPPERVYVVDDYNGKISAVRIPR